MFLICDAPCHGNKYHDGLYDNYQNGDPNGLHIEALMEKFCEKKIAFTVIKLDSNCNKMIEVMKKHHPLLTVTDLEKATKTKSAAEVSKMFVESASYIIRATVGRKSNRKAIKTGEPLWDPKKLEVSDIFSSISYLKVTNIDGSKVTVTNHLNGSWFISADLLEKDMWSADHFE